MGLKQIAQDLGVSVATVSNAMSGKGRVSPEMARQVRDHAAQIGYRPSAPARALKTGRSGILGFVMPDITQPLFPRFAQAVEKVADGLGYGVLIADARDDADGQEQALARLVRRGVDGIVIVPQRGTQVAVVSVPIAIINTPSDKANTVSADHAQGGALAAQAIVRLGHRHILLLGGDPLSEVQQDRIAGMCHVLPDHVTYDIAWARYKMPEVADLVAQGVTAVLAVTDLLALRVLSDALQAGVGCPAQISIIGFDDLPFGTVMRPALSTVAPDIAEISQRAVTHLHARIEGRQACPPTAVNMALILRQSTGPAPEIT